jgi:hypothetical protein
MEVGDRNTSYFHKQAESRNQFKIVKEIQVQNQTITDLEGIKAEEIEAFEELYTKMQRKDIDPKEYPLSLILNLIKEDINNSLTKEVTQQEIKEALDQMNPDKAPSPNGFRERFYQQSWYIIKSDLTKLIRKYQSCSKLGGGTNSAFLALISKEKGEISFDRF